MNRFSACLTLAMLSFLGPAPAAAQARDQAAVKAGALAWMSTNPQVVAAVQRHNATPSAESRAMTQEKWKALSVLDPFVRALSKNPLAQYLKERRDDSWAEIFVSGADGTKVALLNKTTSWSHLGTQKHGVPMRGKTWIGEVEVDVSSGLEQIQIGLPVLDGGKPIGSIVIGLSITKLD